MLGHAYADGCAERLNRKGREGREGREGRKGNLNARRRDRRARCRFGNQGAQRVRPGHAGKRLSGVPGTRTDIRGLDVSQEKPFPIRYAGAEISVGYRIDLLLNQLVIVELKAVERHLPIHMAQVLSYLKLSDCKLGFLINFSVLHLKDGIKRVVNGL